MNTIAVDKEAIVIVELSEGTWREEDAVRIGDKLSEKLGIKVIVVPHGIKVKALFLGGVYHRERLGDYEVEVIANNEEDLKKRLQIGELVSREVVSESSHDAGK